LPDDVKTFVGFGEHRAGTPQETATAIWFQHRLEGLSYEAELQTFPIRTILEPGGSITVGNATVNGFPQWPPPAAALGNMITAPFLPLDAGPDEPSIRIMTQPAPLSGNWSAAQDALVADAVAKGALALVLAPGDPTGDLYVSNQHNSAPFPIPVLLIARRDLAQLAPHAAQRGAPARLTLTGAMTDTNAINVIARKPGHGRTLVLSTPLTGWFHCGAERGPGIAVLLRMAAIFARSPRPVLVLGTGSHEIGDYGMEHLLAHGAPPPDEVACWMHFGASLAATKLDTKSGTVSPKVMIGTETSQTWVRAALSPQVPIYLNGSAASPGEAGQVLGARHTRFAGLIGTFPGFHTPTDRGEAIDFELLEKIADASASLIQQVSGLDD
jgi:hypothetical protein